MLNRRSYVILTKRFIWKSYDKGCEERWTRFCINYVFGRLLKCTCWWILFEMIEFLSDTSNYILNYTRLIIEILKSSKLSVISFNNFETAFNDYIHQKSAFGTKIYFLPSIPILAISPYILSIYKRVNNAK